MTFKDLSARLARLRHRWRESAAPVVDTRIQVPAPPAGQNAWRAAVVGVGGWGRAHAAILAALDGVELVALADRAAAAREALPENLQPPQVAHYAELDALLADTGPIDLLSIATNSPAHTPLAAMALAAGVPRVVIEKPIGTGCAQVDALLDQATRCGAKLSVNLSRRWSGDYQAIKRWLDQGELGPLRHVSLVLGDGGFGMSGIHFLDLAAYFLGDPPVRHAYGALAEDRTAAERGAAFFDPPGWGAIVFEGGARLFVDLSPDLVKRDRLFVLRCAHGRIEIDELARRWTVVTASGRRIRFGFRDSITAGGWLRRHFAETFGNEPSRCDGATGLAALEMVLGIHCASRDGRAVPLPLAGADRDIEVPFP